MTRTTHLAPLLERFFVQRLMQQRQASPHTISSYFSPARKSMRCSRRRTEAPGRDGATTPSSSPPCKRGFGCRG